MNKFLPYYIATNPYYANSCEPSEPNCKPIEPIVQHKKYVPISPQSSLTQNETYDTARFMGNTTKTPNFGSHRKIINFRGNRGRKSRGCEERITINKLTKKFTKPSPSNEKLINLNGQLPFQPQSGYDVFEKLENIKIEAEFSNLTVTAIAEKCAKRWVTLSKFEQIQYQKHFEEIQISSSYRRNT